MASALSLDADSHLEKLHSLSPEDVTGIQWVLRQCPLLSIKEAGIPAGPAWESVGTVSSISISRQLPSAPERVYKLRGVGTIAARAEAIYEMIVRVDLMRLWDPLQRSGHLLSWESDAAEGVEQGLAYTVYGVGIPGASAIFHNRDLLTRIVTVRLPGGVSVLYAKSCPDGGTGDPGPQRRTVRAHMGASGWVLVPQQDGTTGVSVILQVDPKGGVPPFIVNSCGIAIPLHIHRMAKVLRNMAPHKLQKIVSEQRRDVLAPVARPLPPALSTLSASAGPHAAQLYDSSDATRRSSFACDASDSSASTAAAAAGPVATAVKNHAVLHGIGGATDGKDSDTSATTGVTEALSATAGQASPL